MKLASRRPALALVTGVLVCGVAAAAGARPDRIRPGHSYYSDEYVISGQVRDIGEERNYEEVYQRYTYYEVIYDELKRVVVFKEYRRGSVIRVEHYRYAADGRLLERIVQPSELPAPSGSETNAEPEANPSPKPPHRRSADAIEGGP